MKTEIKYIELKSNYNHNGPAWIGLVAFSKSGKTVYFDGKAFQRMGSDRMLGNYYDIESGEEYWISGFKENMTDRHKYGGGKVLVEERILQEYLSKTKQQKLDSTKFSICQVNKEIPKERINEIENETYENDSEINDNKRFLKPSEMSETELEYFIDYYNYNSIESRHLKNRKFARTKRNELVEEKERRKEKTNENTKK